MSQSNKLEVGSRYKNNKGKWFTIIEFNNSTDVLVRFDERQFEKRTKAYYIKTGVVALPTYFVGDKFIDKYGKTAEIVKIDTTSKITFKWEDGATRVLQSSAIINNSLIHPSDSCLLNPEMKVGDKYLNFQGIEFEIEKYIAASHIVVSFSVPFKHSVKTTQGNIKKGNVHNYHVPSVAGVGIVGDSEHNCRDKMYRSWSGMLKRVYSPPTKETAVTYQDCSVREDWHYLSNFSRWYDKQILEPDWHLDKDLLLKGNTQYSEDTCVFVPREINTFLTDRARHRGMWPVGVTYHERILKWQAACNVDGKSQYLGVYYSPEEAFIAYKKCKENYAKTLAEKWRDRIDPRAYEALMNYTVEITD